MVEWSCSHEAQVLSSSMSIISQQYPASQRLHLVSTFEFHHTSSGLTGACVCTYPPWRSAKVTQQLYVSRKLDCVQRWQWGNHIHPRQHIVYLWHMWTRHDTWLSFIGRLYIATVHSVLQCDFETQPFPVKSFRAASWTTHIWQEQFVEQLQDAVVCVGCRHLSSDWVNHWILPFVYWPRISLSVFHHNSTWMRERICNLSCHIGNFADRPRAPII